MRLEPDAPSHHLALADAYRLAARSDEATAAYQRVLELDPENETARQRLDELR